MDAPRSPIGPKLITTTALAPAIWGTSYYASTEFLPPDRPLLAGTVRALPSGVALLLATRRLPHGWWWLKVAVLGSLNIGAFFALLFVAAYRLPGGVAATLGAIQPLAAAGLGALLLSEPIRRHLVTAGLLGMVGVAMLVLRADAELDAVGVVAGLAGALSMATGVVLTKRWGRPVPLLTFTSWQLVAGGLVLLPLMLLAEGPPPMPTTTNLIGYAWLTIIGTVLAYNLWFRGVQAIPVAQVSLLGVLSPLVAALVGLVALGQTLTFGQLVGVALILAALIIGQRDHSNVASVERHHRGGGEDANRRGEAERRRDDRDAELAWSTNPRGDV
jgi:probable blue pigment (indigoidine) exporter